MMSPGARRRPRGSRQCTMRCPRSPPRHEFVRAIHDVRVRETEGGEIVNFHCVVDQTLSVAERARQGRRGGTRAAAALSLDQARARTRRAGAGLEMTRLRRHTRPRPAGGLRADRTARRWPRKRITRDFGLHAGLRHDVKKFTGVRAGEVRDRHDMPLLPKQANRESSECRTCECRRRPRARPSSPP